MKFFSHVWITLALCWSTASLFATEYIFARVPALVAPDPRFVIMESCNSTMLIYRGDLVREFETGLVQGVQLMSPDGTPGSYISIELVNQYYPNWKVCYLPRLPVHFPPSPYFMMVKKWVEIPIRRRRPPPGIPFPTPHQRLSSIQAFAPDIPRASEPATSTPNPWNPPLGLPSFIEGVSPIPAESPQGEVEEVQTHAMEDHTPTSDLWLRRAATRAAKGIHDGLQPPLPLTLNEGTDTSH